jgi:phenylacetate-coenzyme A ligase PaaK-like adenylate-forming protein
MPAGRQSRGADVRSDWKMRVYWKLPVSLQEQALSFYARRLNRLYYGGSFEDECREIRGSHWADPEAIGIWQMARLRQILGAASRWVPHYRKKLEGLELDRLQSPSDLCQIPMMDRHAIRQHETDFLDKRLNRKTLFKDKTSGSTGTSITVFWPPPPLRRLQAALEVRVRNVGGVSRLIPRAMIGGRPIVPGETRHPPFWRFNRYWRQLYMSSYHVSRDTAPLYVAALRKSGVEWINGYGSAIAALAESAAAAGVAPIRMRCVIVSGDTLQPGMRRSIETFFQCRCYDSYGQVEGVSMAMECQSGRLHLVPEIGIVEIVRENDQPCSAGEVGEMVATGILNDGMPFVRYRTGDFAAYAVEQRCDCRSNHPVIEALEGRVDDYLITSDGRRIGRLSTAMKRSPSIHSAQIVQDRPGHAYLLVRPGNGYRSADAVPVRNDIIERIGAFDFEILEVKEIPKTPKGKTRLVVRLEEKPELTSIYRPVLEGSQGEADKAGVS